MGVSAANEEDCITRAAFCEFYADISMSSFDDNAFIKLVENTWQINEPAS